MFIVTTIIMTQITILYLDPTLSAYSSGLIPKPDSTPKPPALRDLFQSRLPQYPLVSTPLQQEAFIFQTIQPSPKPAALDLQPAASNIIYGLLYIAGVICNAIGQINHIKNQAAVAHRPLNAEEKIKINSIITATTLQVGAGLIALVQSACSMIFYFELGCKYLSPEKWFPVVHQFLAVSVFGAVAYRLIPILGLFLSFVQAAVDGWKLKKQIDFIRKMQAQPQSARLDWILEQCAKNPLLLDATLLVELHRMKNAILVARRGTPQGRLDLAIEEQFVSLLHQAEVGAKKMAFFHAVGVLSSLLCAVGIILSAGIFVTCPLGALVAIGVLALVLALWHDFRVKAFLENNGWNFGLRHDKEVAPTPLALAVDPAALAEASASFSQIAASTPAFE